MRKEDQWNRQGTHEITGDGSCQISAYKLPATDQDTERRNFPGYKTYSPGEALMEEISCEGTTETRGGRTSGPRTGSSKGMNHAIKHDSAELKRRFNG